MGCFIPRTTTSFLIVIILFLVFCLFLRNKDNDFTGIKGLMSKDVTDQFNYIISGKAVKKIGGQSDKVKFLRPSLKTFEISNNAKMNRLCKETVEYLFNKTFDEVKPDFLLNPFNNKNLKLSCYNNKLKLAIEYKGTEYYNYPNFKNESRDKFELRLKLSDWKKEMCDNTGIYLIEVPYTIELSEVPHFIWKQIPEHLKVFIVNDDKLKKI